MMSRDLFQIQIGIFKTIFNRENFIFDLLLTPSIFYHSQADHCCVQISTETSESLRAASPVPRRPGSTGLTLASPG